MNFAAIDWAQLILGLAVLMLSLSIHESAHAWAADRLGDPTGRSLGRVSLNPLVHIDPVGTVLFPLVGLIAGGVIFGWAKPVPVNVNNLKDPRFFHVLVAAAGPVSNIVTAAGFLILLKLMSSSVLVETMAGSFWEPVEIFLRLGLILNIILAVFNLLPIPPLDGSWILEGLLPQQLGQVFTWIRPYGFVLLILLFYSGILSSILGPILSVVYELTM